MTIHSFKPSDVQHLLYINNSVLFFVKACGPVTIAEICEDALIHAKVKSLTASNVLPLVIRSIASLEDAGLIEAYDQEIDDPLDYAWEAT